MTPREETMALVAQGGSDDLHNCCINRFMGRGNDNHNEGKDEVMNTEIQHLKGER